MIYRHHRVGNPGRQFKLRDPHLKKAEQ